MSNLKELFAETAEFSSLRLELGPLTTTYARVCLLPQQKQWLQAHDLRIGHLNSDLSNATTITALTEKQPAAIGYLLSKRDETIPAFLIKEAKKLNITLFSIPPDTTATAIESASLKLGLCQDNSNLASFSQLNQQLLKTLDDHKA